jgi:hypothetical protein
MTMAQTSYRVLAGGAHAMQPRLLDAWRAATAALARDDTEASAKRRCLVVAPHPDDETLGCGATIARKRAAGTAVLVAVVADGRYAQSRSTMISPSELASIRAAEAVAACARLGVDADDVVQLGHEDTHVAEAEQQVTEELHDLISRFRRRSWSCAASITIRTTELSTVRRAPRYVAEVRIPSYTSSPCGPGSTARGWISVGVRRSAGRLPSSQRRRGACSAGGRPPCRPTGS